MKWWQILSIFGLCILFAAPSEQIEFDDKNYQETKRKKSYITLYPHKAFYILPFYHSFSIPSEGNIDTETKFQLSFKLSFSDRLFSPYGSFNFAYTQTAWFQNYHKKDSRPFRDIDYQPELFYSYERPLEFLGGKLRDISFGYNHLSNGERILRSRTQNRILLSMRWEYGDEAYSLFGIRLGAWVYFGIHQNGFRHDNGDLTLYRGYNEVLFYYRNNSHLLELYIRPLIAKRYYPHFELDYTLRVGNNFGIYCQYIHGYGDSIFEYNQFVQRIGVGFRLWNE